MSPPPTALPDTHFHLQCGLQTPLTEGLPQDTVWSQTLWSWLCSTERRRGTQEPPLPHQSWPSSCPYEHSEEFSLARFSFPVLNFSVWVPTLKHGYVKKNAENSLLTSHFRAGVTSRKQGNISECVKKDLASIQHRLEDQPSDGDTAAAAHGPTSGICFSGEEGKSCLLYRLLFKM